MEKFEKGDKVKVALGNPKKWVDATVEYFMKGYTARKNDGYEYYVIDVDDVDVDDSIHFFASADCMFREGEELPDIDELKEKHKKKN